MVGKPERCPQPFELFRSGRRRTLCSPKRRLDVIEALAIDEKMQRQ